MNRLQSYIYQGGMLLVTLLIPVLGMTLLGTYTGQASMIEICDNAIDDDMDGLIDLNDSDCDCQIIEPISYIPNPSFEDQNCCPSDRSQLNCATSWIQASLPTTDYIHSCGWGGWENFPPPQPFPDGAGIMGFRDGRVRGGNSAEPNWKEYAGACLLRPLRKDSTYRFDFDIGFVNPILSPPINITFFGTSDCSFLPFGQERSDFGCPTNGNDWVELAAVRTLGNNAWLKATITVTPDVDIYAIAIGPECAEIANDVSTYYFFDNLLLADQLSFDLQIKDMQHPCQTDYTLSVRAIDGIDYQWYKDGVALIGEVDPELVAAYGNGAYQVLIDDGQSCKSSAQFNYVKPIIRTTSNVVICKEDAYPFGNNVLTAPGSYTHTFTSVNNCDSIVDLNLRVLGEIADTVAVKIFDGESYAVGNQRFKNEGDYFITLQSSFGCDSLVLLQLEYFHIYFPNAFSPNQDGSNDTFTLFYEDGLVEEYDMEIYDRWGNLIYEGIEWDGTHKGETVNAGVFVYQANVRMNDGVERLITGSVSVLR